MIPLIQIKLEDLLDELEYLRMKHNNANSLETLDSFQAWLEKKVHKELSKTDDERIRETMEQILKLLNE